MMSVVMREIRPIVKYLRASVHVPGSKSVTQRALVAASLAEGESRLENALFSEDTGYLVEALKALGATINREDRDLVVCGTGGQLTNPGHQLFLGNNGTALRFLVSVVSLGRGTFVLTGNERLCQRPVKPLLDALGGLGVAAFGSGDRAGYPPVTVQAAGLSGGETAIEGAESSQYVSSLLMSAPYAHRDVTIRLTGRSVSQPYIAMTLKAMADFGVSVREDRRGCYFVKAGQRYRGRRYFVEGDASSASYFFLAAALCGGSVRVEGIGSEMLQGDMGFLDLLEDAGCLVLRDKDWTEVQGMPLAGGDRTVDMGDMPDMVPTMAVLAAFRPGRTVITNVPHLRLKESDRLAALARELKLIGAEVEERADGLIVKGGHLHGGEIETYRDHRIAMSFAVAGLAVPGIRIRDPQCVDKSFPEFWKELDGLYGE